MDFFPCSNLSTILPSADTMLHLQSTMSLTMLLSNLLFFFLAVASASSRPSNDLIVTTTSGVFEGFYPYRTVRAFLGIPYSKPPVGDLRFEPAQALVSKNKAAIDASSFGKTCFQFRYKTIGFEKRGPTTGESEDCLTINVWGPANRKGKKLLPALV